MFEWFKLSITIIFIVLMVIAFLRQKNVLNWLVGLLIAHSVIIFSLRFFIGNESFADSVQGGVFFLVITVFTMLIYRALKADESS